MWRGCRCRAQLASPAPPPAWAAGGRRAGAPAAAPRPRPPLRPAATGWHNSAPTPPPTTRPRCCGPSPTGRRGAAARPLPQRWAACAPLPTTVRGEAGGRGGSRTRLHPDRTQARAHVNATLSSHPPPPHPLLPKLTRTTALSARTAASTTAASSLLSAATSGGSAPLATTARAPSQSAAAKLPTAAAACTNTAPSNPGVLSSSLMSSTAPSCTNPSFTRRLPMIALFTRRSACNRDSGQRSDPSSSSACDRMAARCAAAPGDDGTMLAWPGEGELGRLACPPARQPRVCVPEGAWRKAAHPPAAWPARPQLRRCVLQEQEQGPQLKSRGESWQGGTAAAAAAAAAVEGALAPLPTRPPRCSPSWAP